MENTKLDEVKRIKEEYTYHEKTNYDELKRLDRKAKLPSIIFAYTFGILSSLVLGFGMSIVLGSVLTDYMVLGYISGGIGLLFISINYPIYRLLNKKGIKKYRDEVLALSNTILEN